MFGVSFNSNIKKIEGDVILKNKKLLALLLTVVMMFTQFAMLGTVSAEETAPDFKVGVAAHPWSPEYSSNLEDFVYYAAEMGSNIIRIDFARIGEANIKWWDKFFALCDAYGISVIGVANSAAEAKIFASRYTDQIAYIQLGNEFDVRCTVSDDVFGTEKEHYDSQKVAECIQEINTIQTAVKSVAPNMLTMINIADSHYGFIQHVVDSGIAIDAVGIDWYSNMDRLGSLDVVLDNITEKFDLPIWITECNVEQDVTGSNDAIMGETIISYLETCKEKQATNNILGFVVYELFDEPHFLEGEDVDDKTKIEANFGLININGVEGSYVIDGPKDAYYQIQEYLGFKENAVEKITYSSALRQYQPEMNNTHLLKNKLDYELNYSGSDIWGTFKSESQLVDMSEGYLEFDIYVESADATTSFQLYVRDENQRTKLTGVGGIETNKWVHKVIPVSSFGYGDADMSKIFAFYLDGINAENIYNITNTAITVYPEMNNTHSLKTELSYSLDNVSGQYWDTERAANNGETVDMSNGYIEFDAFVTSAQTTAWFQIFLKDSNGGTKFAGTGDIETNKWVHVVIPVTKFAKGYGEDADMSIIKNIYLDALQGNTFTITNAAVTDYPEMNNTHSLKTELTYGLDNVSGQYWDTERAANNDETVDMSNGYIEFDAFVTSAQTTAWFQIFLKDSNGGTKFAGTGDIETNKWVHVVIPVTEFTKGYGEDADMSIIKNIYLDALQGNTFTITNAAVTDHPKMSNSYPLMTKLTYELKDYKGDLWGTQKSVYNNETVDMSNGYLEFDVLAESADVNTSLQIYALDSNGNYKVANTGNFETNKWVHKVIALSDFTAGDGDMGAIKTFRLDMVNGNNKYSLINVAITGSPKMNNTHALKTELSYGLENYKGGVYWETQKFALNGTTVDMSKGYLEFDAYIESSDATTSFQVCVMDESGKTKLAGSGTIETNKWVHKVISLDTFGYGDADMSKVKYIYLDAFNSNNTHTIINTAVTGYPEMNNTYSLKTALTYELNNYKGDLWGTQKSVYGDQTADMSEGYLEFDVFVESADATTGFQLFALNSNDSYKLVGVGDIETNKWVHKIIPLSSFSYGDADMSAIMSFRLDGVNGNNTYTITNVAITTEKTYETGDANCDEEIDILDLVVMKKIALQMEGYDYRKSADFNGDGIIDGTDLIYMRKLVFDLI